MRGHPTDYACWAAGGLWVIFSITACGSGQSDALKKQISTLEDRVSMLLNQNDALEARLSVLENQPSRGRPVAEAPVTTVEQAPLLQVVKLVPPSGADADRPDESTNLSGAAATSLGSGSGADGDAPRPLIRGTGSRLESRDPALPPGPKSGAANERPGPDGGKLPRGVGR